MKLKNFLLVLMIVQINLYVYSQGVNQYGQITTGMQKLTQSQRDLLASPSAGSIIWCSNCGLRGELQVYDGVGWTNAVGTTASNPYTAPSLSTTAVTSITASSAISGGTVINNGGSAITASGVCWSTSSGPTISSSKTTDGTGSGSFTSTLTGLSDLTTYYVRAYATNNVGTAYGAEISFTTPSAIQIGVDYEGGKVAYIFESGDPGYVQGEVHGLIANLNDLTAGWWGATNYHVTGTSASIGSGNANTVNIVGVNGTIGEAAYSCANLTSGGKSDWYLPSSQEAAKLYLNKTVLGLADAPYWTSTQFDTGYAYSIHMQTGVVSSNWKAIDYRVRPVRTF